MAEVRITLSPHAVVQLEELMHRQEHTASQVVEHLLLVLVPILSRQLPVTSLDVLDHQLEYMQEQATNMRNLVTQMRHEVTRYADPLSPQ